MTINPFSQVLAWLNLVFILLHLHFSFITRRQTSVLESFDRSISFDIGIRSKIFCFIGCFCRNCQTVNVSRLISEKKDFESQILKVSRMQRLFSINFPIIQSVSISILDKSILMEYSSPCKCSWEIKLTLGSSIKWLLQNFKEMITLVGSLKSTVRFSLSLWIIDPVRSFTKHWLTGE